MTNFGFFYTILYKPCIESTWILVYFIKRYRPLILHLVRLLDLALAYIWKQFAHYLYVSINYDDVVVVY